jgi:hypothetical protein
MVETTHSDDEHDPYYDIPVEDDEDVEEDEDTDGDTEEVNQRAVSRRHASLRDNNADRDPDRSASPGAGLVTQTQTTLGKDTLASKTLGKDTLALKTLGKDTLALKTAGKDIQSAKTTGKATQAEKTRDTNADRDPDRSASPTEDRRGPRNQTEPARTATQPQPGTLHRWILDSLHTTPTASPTDDEQHIKTWGQSMERGWEAFSIDLLRYGTRANLKPLVFAMVTNGDPVIHIAHGFGQLNLDTVGHRLNGKLGCFLGDRTALTLNGETVIQDPDFVLLRDPLALRGVEIKPAADGAIKKMNDNGEFIKGTARVEVNMPSCLPLPLTWVPYFLEQKRTNKEAYLYMSKKMAKWSGQDDIRLSVVGWFRAACTYDTNSQDISIIDVNTYSLPREQETAQWTLVHLQGVVPRPSPRTVSPSVASSAHTPRSSSPESEGATNPSQIELCNRVLALSDHILAAKVEREKAPAETGKSLSEAELCKLLGFCGLHWHNRHLLPPVWADLKRQPDRASRETVLKAFFEEIATTEKSLRGFTNHALVDDIINHRFVPGDRYDTCHKGFSPLAMLPRTHSDMFDAATDEAHYNEAGGNKTLAEIKRHRTKGPPPIPSNDAEFIRLNSRDVAILAAFFTEHSSLVQQEQELHEEMLDQQTDLFSDPNFTRKMIPQMIWAKIKARRTFFGTTCTRAQLDPPENTPPKRLKARLSHHALAFISGTEIKIGGTPMEWTTQNDGQGPTKKARYDNNARPTGEDKNPRSSHQPSGGGGARGPKAPTEGKGTNPAQPAIFAKSTEIADLLRKHPRVYLTTIAEASGLGDSSGLPQEGLPKQTCLRWIAFGTCNFPNCARAHPAAVDDAAAQTLYRALLPGINAVREMKDLPPQRRGK